jgi:hypothetical protein
MKRSATWLVAAALLTLTLPSAKGVESSQEDNYNPRSEVDGFLRFYHGTVLTDSSLLEHLGYLIEWSIAIREIGDKRLVGPLSEIISDTTRHSDEVSSCAIDVLKQIRGRAAVPSIRRYLTATTKPRSRLEAASALAVLGDAESGVPVLEWYLMQPYPLAPGFVSGTLMYTFLDNCQAVKLDNAAQDAVITSFFQRVAGWVTDQNLATTICYLLQKGEKSRDIAFRRAEEVLRDVTAPNYVRSNVDGCLERFGGERGKALRSKYQ